MTDTVFDVMALTPYTFLQIVRGGIEGNTVSDQTEATGVFKFRGQMVRGENAETKESNATLHIRPDEPFIAFNDGNLVGHGVLIEAKTYEIIGATGGQNYDNGVREHYTATLQESQFPDFVESS